MKLDEITESMVKNPTIKTILVFIETLNPHAFVNSNS